MNRKKFQFLSLTNKATRIVAYALLSLSLIGCTHIQLYEGKHSSSVISIIKPYSAFHEYGVGGTSSNLIHITEADGVKAGTDGFGKITAFPGQHTLTVELRYRRNKSHLVFETTKHETLNFETKVGKEYFVYGRHGGPTGTRIWVSEVATGKVVAGNGPPEHITADKNISFPFERSVWVYAEVTRMLGQVVYKRSEGTLSVNNGSVEIRSCTVGDQRRGCHTDAPLGAIENIQKIVLGKFYTDIGYGVREEDGRDVWIEAIFLHYMEAGKNKYIVLTSIPSDTELDSYIYSALLQGANISHSAVKK